MKSEGISFPFAHPPFFFEDLVKVSARVHILPFALKDAHL